MYNLNCKPRSIISILIVLIILYGAQLFVVWTGYCLFDKGLNWIGYIIPLAVLVIITILILLGICCSESLFSFAFFIFGLFLGYLIYILFTAIIIRIIDACVDIPLAVGLPILLGLPFIICVYGFINAKITKLVKHSLEFAGYKGKTSILHLSDIHLGTIHQKASIEKIVGETKKLNPDIVVITGDMADGSLQVKEEWLRPFNELTMPILYITGNHEMMNPKKEMIQAVEKTKIIYIGNYGKYSFNNINFIGIDFDIDLASGLKNIKQEENIPNVLLCHVPNIKPEELANFNVFLFLGGHTHGGQLFPFQIPAYLMNACFSGLYSDKDKKHHVFVSEGVNNAIIPMRIGSNRIFALITITGVETEDKNDNVIYNIKD